MARRGETCQRGGLAAASDARSGRGEIFLQCRGAARVVMCGGPGDGHATVARQIWLDGAPFCGIRVGEIVRWMGERALTRGAGCGLTRGWGRDGLGVGGWEAGGA